MHAQQTRVLRMHLKCTRVRARSHRLKTIPDTTIHCTL